MDRMEKIDSSSLDLEAKNIAKLKELFPNVVTEDKIDFDMLREMLGDEIEEKKEKYQFTWNGKSNAIKIAQSTSTSTLRPCREKSSNWDLTENLYIEGDNLEVLKQLQKTYFGSIKLIYIDPPYNTGGDFVYHDEFKKGINAYVSQTEQMNSSNPETNGRYHTDWLNMMYPRLLLARNLLSNDGVICISIDDHEQENAKKICDEIFGATNFVAQVVWERAFAPINLKKHFSSSHDYILFYAKHIDELVCNGLPRTAESNARYSNPDNDPRGVWQSDNATVGPAVQEKVYELCLPSGRKILPPSGRCWLYTKERFAEMIADNRIWFGKEGDNVPRVKRFLSEVKGGLTPMTIWKYDEVGHSQEASQYLKKLFDNKAYFDHPKPVKLIQRCMELYSGKDSIVMDFFSGSATTAEAVLRMNLEDNGNRKFIMVQLPEVVKEGSTAYQDGYRNICDIGEERIKRAAEKVLDEWNAKNKGEGLFEDNNKCNLDLGFKTFRLDSTNIIEWDSEQQIDDLDILLNQVDTFKSERSKDDILYEILLKYGIFNMKVNDLMVNDKKMYRIGGRYMIVCLDDEINSEDVKAIGELKPKVVVFKDSGFKNDNVKINAMYNLKNAGVEDVRSI